MSVSASLRPILGLLLGLTGCGLFNEPIQEERVFVGEGGCKRPAANVGINPTDLDLTLGKFREFITLPAIKYKNDPKVSQLLQNQDTGLLVIDYLICTAKHRKDIDDTPEQIRYFTNWLNFMSTSPTSKDVIEWEEKHPFPKDKIKVTARPEQAEIAISLGGREISVNTSQLAISKDITKVANPKIFQDSILGFAFELPADSKWPQPKQIKGVDQYLKRILGDGVTDEMMMRMAAHPFGQALRDIESLVFVLSESLAVERTENTSIPILNEAIAHSISGIENSDAFRKMIAEMVKGMEEEAQAGTASEERSHDAKSLVEAARKIKTISDFEKVVKMQMDLTPEKASELKQFLNMRKSISEEVMRASFPIQKWNLANEFSITVFHKDKLVGSPIRSLASFYSVVGSQLGAVCDRLVANGKGILTGGTVSFNNIKINGVEGPLTVSRAWFFTESQHSYFLVEIAYSPQANSSIKVWEDLRKATDSFSLIEST